MLVHWKWGIVQQNPQTDGQVPPIKNEEGSSYNEKTPLREKLWKNWILFRKVFLGTMALHHLFIVWRIAQQNCLEISFVDVESFSSEHFNLWWLFYETEKADWKDERSKLLAWQQNQWI